MNGATKLVCFDLDDTLIFNVHSVMFLCILNNRYEQLLDIEKRESAGEIDWITADHYKAELLAGLAVSKIQIEFDRIIKPIKNIALVVNELRKRNILSIVITSGPVQVANAIKEIYGFNGSYGSEYEVVDGVFTGKILNHIVNKGKIVCLMDFCEKNNITPNECVAVGDGSTDIPLFEYCQESIAINYSPSVAGKATHYIKTQDLSEVLVFIT
jgi:phosphoserine phosphatase